MKNQNLFNFQNGMAYALSTTTFGNATEYEQIYTNSDFFWIDENNCLIPKQTEKWSKTSDYVIIQDDSTPSHFDSPQNMYRYIYAPYYVTAGNEKLIVTNEGYLSYIQETDWDEVRFLIPVHTFGNVDFTKFTKIKLKVQLARKYGERTNHISIGYVETDNNNYYVDAYRSMQSFDSVGNYDVEYRIMSGISRLDYFVIEVTGGDFLIKEIKLV